jgi:predicted NBD/HSP70 family sugar kinase
MMKHSIHKSNQTSSAVHNRRLTVELLRHHGALSRQQLSQITGLRSSTLTYIVRELLENRVVRTIGKRESKTVGKKQVLLEINPDLGWVVGIGIDRDSMSLSFLDAAGKIIGQERQATGHIADELPGQLADHINKWADGNGESMQNLLGVGIAAPGVVDYKRGTLLKSTWLNTQNFPLGQRVSEAVGVPVMVDNDANFAALAEARRGSARGLGTFIYFYVSSQQRGEVLQIYGLGSTYFLDHKLYRGTHFGAGEVDPSLEPSASETDRVTPEQLAVLADPDGPITAELMKITSSLAATMASVVNLIDPEAVILGGNVSLANKQAMKNIESVINSTIVPLPNRNVEVRASTFVDHGNSVGAAISAIEAVQIVEGEPLPVGQIPTASAESSKIWPKPIASEAE